MLKNINCIVLIRHINVNTHRSEHAVICHCRKCNLYFSVLTKLYTFVANQPTKQITYKNHYFRIIFSSATVSLSCCSTTLLAQSVENFDLYCWFYCMLNKSNFLLLVLQLQKSVEFYSFLFAIIMYVHCALRMIIYVQLYNIHII